MLIKLLVFIKSSILKSKVLVSEIWFFLTADARGLTQMNCEVNGKLVGRGRVYYLVGF